MSKLLVVSLALASSLRSTVARAEALDDERFKACQATRRLIVDGHACPVQAAATQRLFCSSKTYWEMAALYRECMRIHAGAPSDHTMPADTSKEDKDSVKCVLVHVGAKDVVPPIEIDWAKGQPHVDKITPANAELLCHTQAYKPATEWGKANNACDGLVGPARSAPKYTVQWGRASNPKTIEKGAGIYCKPLHH
jgi:hypothetical protein